MSSDRYKRVNVLITHQQHEEIAKLGLNFSGLVRDLLDDRFSETSIAINVSKQTKELYDTVISNFGTADADLEPYLLKALDEFLKSKTSEIDNLRKKISKK